ncbi:hypothetical protein CFN78_12435 [Amycolatopsis antarctica]|uniref:Secreted protein n=1 Tax=Amycolatopsis antarctica TaxID=1854586 RepID=A0A263D3L2_9PSEU|nr:hypothetical protein [Amycolatopsis antarctica]OZM73030.1 hypothetical protein CFN78_12435 [Amycolatopsis antarctica]
MKRIFWFSLGAAAGVAMSRKATETARQASPAGIASNVGDAFRELAGAVGSFGADVRAGMSEREQELNDIVHERSAAPARADVPAVDGRHAASRRARRAEG